MNVPSVVPDRNSLLAAPITTMLSMNTEAFESSSPSQEFNPKPWKFFPELVVAIKADIKSNYIALWCGFAIYVSCMVVYLIVKPDDLHGDHDFYGVYIGWEYTSTTVIAFALARIVTELFLWDCKRMMRKSAGGGQSSKVREEEGSEGSIPRSSPSEEKKSDIIKRLLSKVHSSEASNRSSFGGGLGLGGAENGDGVW